MPATRRSRRADNAFADKIGQEGKNCHDVHIRANDLSTLNRCEWLNDQVISFQNTLLINHKYKSVKENVVIFSPAVAHCLKFLDKENEIADMIKDDLRSKRLILVPVNNASAYDDGSHWSLLLLAPQDDSVIHVDSSRCSNNAKVGLTIARKLAPFAGIDNIDQVFWELNSEDQKNNYDCGMYTLKNAEKAIRCFSGLVGGDGEFCPATSSEVNLRFRQQAQKMIIDHPAKCA